MNVLPGSTGVSVDIDLVDLTTNGPALGVDVTTLNMGYFRPAEGEGVVQDATVGLLAATGSPWATGEAIELSATILPGVYRFDFANAAFAAGVHEVTLVVTDANDNKIGSKTVSLGGVEANVVKLAGGEYKIAYQSGNWGTSGTWSDSVVPAAGDNIIIRDNVTVTIAASINLGQFGTLEKQGDGVLDIASGQTVAAVPRGWVVSENLGTVTNNYGTITINYEGTVTTNHYGGTVTFNYYGTIADNYGTVTNNSGTVTNNYGTITTNYGAITGNNSVVEINHGTVTTNHGNGIVLHNYGTIGTDNGESGDTFKTKIAYQSGNWATAGTWSDGVVPAAGDNIIIRNGVTVTIAASLNLGQFGTLELQGDGVLNIAPGQTVAVVPSGWAINTNPGTVTKNNGVITQNGNVVTTNNGIIVSNADTVTTNSGTIGTNQDAKTVVANNGTIIVNRGTVATNTGAGIVEINTGTVTANNAGGVVLHNYGTITTDSGKSDVPRVTLVDTTTSVTNKAGYALSSSGLNSIPITPPIGPATTFREMVVATWRRLYRKVDMNATTLTDYKDDDATPNTTQPLSDVAGTQTQGSAS